MIQISDDLQTVTTIFEISNPVMATRRRRPGRWRPGLRPHYHSHYYGAYFRDPDGNKLCVCCPDPEPVVETAEWIESNGKNR